MLADGYQGLHAEEIAGMLTLERDRLTDMADGNLSDRHQAEDIVQETATAVLPTRILGLARQTCPSRGIRENGKRV